MVRVPQPPSKMMRQALSKALEAGEDRFKMMLDAIQMSLLTEARQQVGCSSDLMLLLDSCRTLSATGQ